MPAAALVLLTAVTAAAAVTWRDAPAFVRLFAPAPQLRRFSAAISDATLQEVLDGLAGDRAAVRVPGAWTPRRLPAADAFGRSGAHNRWALARVYGSRQPDVARGARMENGRVTESWTLISPYPAPDFSRLEPGTLRIVLQIAP